MIKFYTKELANDIANLSDQYTNGKRGYFLFFRKMAMRMQARFVELYDHKQMPMVLVHGNPHIENYVIAKAGAGMVDFDRSRVGGYAWDVVRFLCSLSLKREEEKDKLLSPIVLEYFQEGYLRGFHTPNLRHKGISNTSEKIEYKVWYDSTTDYLDANKKWGKRMRQNSISTKDKTMLKLLKAYLASRYEEDMLSNYNIEEAGMATGTFGNERYLIVLAPKKNTEEDKIFLEIKTVYQDQDTRYYFNPYKHHGIRMIQASKAYAPNLEMRLGYATHQGIEYWGREIPYMNAKIKESLSELEQLDVAYSVGTQLGKAHRQTLQGGIKGKSLEKHFWDNYADLQTVAVVLNKELAEAYEACFELKKAS